MLNSSLIDAAPSVALTFTPSVSTSAAPAVPENLRAAALKLSHVGSAAPSDFVAS